LFVFTSEGYAQEALQIVIESLSSGDPAKLIVLDSRQMRAIGGSRQVARADGGKAITEAHQERKKALKEDT